MAGQPGPDRGLPPGWLVPDWPAPAHVHALCTARAGGVSQGPWEAFNLGDHVGDDPEAVRENRSRLRRWLAGMEDQENVSAVAPTFLTQVHGTAVADLDADPPDGTESDACAASRPGRACTIMVADCLPVLFTNRTGTRVAAAHAGWRGLAGGVLEHTVARLLAAAPPAAGPAEHAAVAAAVDGSAAQGVLAWLGPCIGPTAFEVGEEVLQSFCTRDAGAAVHFTATRPGKYLANLPGLARRRLAAVGVDGIFGNDGGDAWCTVRQSSRFFSHRASMERFGASGGRFAACVWLGSAAG